MKLLISHSHRNWRQRGYWIPATCRQLRQALREVGVVRIGGRPLGRVRKRQLLAVWHALWKRKRKGN